MIDFSWERAGGRLEVMAKARALPRLRAHEDGAEWTCEFRVDAFRTWIARARTGPEAVYGAYMKWQEGEA